MEEQSTRTWQERVRDELIAAQEARRHGKEGKARVCARRAAGILTKEYLRRMNLDIPSSSAYDLLRRLQDLPDLPDEARGIAANMLVKVNPDYTLPVEADLLDEANRLGEILLGPKSWG